MTPSPAHHARFWHRKPWKWAFSLRVGILLLFVITLASIAGTLIDPLSRACELVFYSLWYRLLLLALAANMTCATLRTLVEKALPWTRQPLHDEEAFFRRRNPGDTCRFDGNPENVEHAFRRRGFRVRRDGPLGFAWTGALGAWGAVVAHAGIVLILLAGFASAWVAEEAVLPLFEGQQTDTMLRRTDPPTEEPMGFTVRCDDFDTGFFPRTHIPSHYVTTVTILDADPPVIAEPVEVNRVVQAGGWKFHQTDYREEPGLARYLLRLRRPEGREPLEIEVSPGQERFVPSGGRTRLELAAAYPYAWEIQPERMSPRTGVLFDGAQQRTLRVDRFEPDFTITETGEVTSRSDRLANPAVQVSVREGAEQVGGRWLFANRRLSGMMDDMLGPQQGPFAVELVEVVGEAPWYRFRLRATPLAAQDGATSPREALLGVGEEVILAPARGNAGRPEQSTDSASGWDVELLQSVTAYSTTLTLTRNPAVPAVYFGCVVMMLGLMLAFFVPRRRVWFRIDAASNKLSVAALYRHGRSEWDARTAAVLEDLGFRTHSRPDDERET